jgi:hypothetical protein
MARGGAVSVVVLGLAVALGAGAAAGVALSAPSAPAVLGEPAAITAVPVTTRQYDDARTVAVTVTTGAAQQVLSPVAGRVTSSSCSPGATLASGQTILTVDGTAIVALATAVAPWRDLDVRDRGTDAQALNDELRRLGYPAPEGDRATTGTVAAFRQLVAAIGGTMPPAGVVPQSTIAWLPAPELVVDQCGAPAGSWIEVGQTIASSVVPVVGARVTDLPADAAPGDRVLKLGDVQVAVAADGSVADAPGLVAIATSAAYRRTTTDASAPAQLNATWVLAQPLSAWVVPPGAIFGLQGSRGCVASGGAVHAVQVVGSELGQSFVVPEDEGTALDEVDAAPDDSATCP